jgi:hypothetical protein
MHEKVIGARPDLARVRSKICHPQQLCLIGWAVMVCAVDDNSHTVVKTVSGLRFRMRPIRRSLGA